MYNVLQHGSSHLLQALLPPNPCSLPVPPQLPSPCVNVDWALLQNTTFLQFVGLSGHCWEKYHILCIVRYTIKAGVVISRYYNLPKISPLMMNSGSSRAHMPSWLSMNHFLTVMRLPSYSKNGVCLHLSPSSCTVQLYRLQCFLFNITLCAMEKICSHGPIFERLQYYLQYIYSARLTACEVGMNHHNSWKYINLRLFDP